MCTPTDNGIEVPTIGCILGYGVSALIKIEGLVVVDREAGVVVVQLEGVVEVVAFDGEVKDGYAVWL